jgi:cation:H+ antiporter
MTHAQRPNRTQHVLWLAIAIAFALQWIVIRLMGWHPPTPWDTVLPGLGIFGAAFLLSWGAELAQLEISQALALAFLALMAVLPEYAVDMYLAWTAAKDPTYTAYAAANMTGANRILIGFGWPVVLLCYWLKTRRTAIQVDRSSRIELATLIIATCYAFIIPLKRSLSLVDTVVLVAIFAFYVVQSAKAHHVEPELEGPPELLALLTRPLRRLVTVALFLFPGATIFMAAEPFAEGLLHGARGLGIEEFLLIQWLAPLASESPEFIVAILFAIRGNARGGLGTLISSKVNQWTLLIGMLPLVYAISAGGWHPMHLDGRQAEEIFLTAGQSLFAIAMLANLSFGLWEGVLLLVLFLAQLFIPVTSVRVGFSILYLVLTMVYLFNRSHRVAFFDAILNGWRVDSRSSGS